MFEYLDDIEFLQKLDKLNLRTQYAKIILFTFDEKPLKEIQGNIVSGSLNVNGSSKTRRTVTLSMFADLHNNNIEDADNEISVNKKIKIMVGYKNPLKSYSYYGDIIWFPCGMFILTSATISRTTSGWNISITGKDKMCMLDGTAGGTLPASTTFHEKLVELNDEGDYEIQYPTIFQIIYEAVNHFGGEPVENIIITDIDDTCKMLVRYMGSNPIYFSDDYGSFDFNASDDFPHMVSYGEDAGYQETDFTYPDELILNAGDTVTTLLDKIVNTLGNYEYFYTVDGKFVFQEIKNYLNTGSPLDELEAVDYTKSYNNAKFLYSLTDLDSTVSINTAPNYTNIKNDFYVWGERESSSGVTYDIRYHLAIDTKPNLNYASQCMWLVKSGNTYIRYDFNDISEGYAVNGYETTLIGSPCEEWREELYRRALVAQVTTSTYDTYYDSELIAEWRGLYDPLNSLWDKYDHWNPDVIENPNLLNFWLDFIDSSAEIGKYSVGQIGRRTKVVNSSDIKTVYNKDVPDIVFLDGTLSQDKLQELKDSYSVMGQDYFILTKEYYDMFSISTTGTSCFDRIREMLYQNLTYNTSITITCLPKYYMEPNNIIRIEDKESNICGNYQVTQFSLPLAYNGTMSITATEVLTRV